MRNINIRENIDPKPFVRAGERGTYCLMVWQGPCPEHGSSLFTSNHDCEVKADHKGPHRCECGRTKRLANDDSQWADV